MILELFIILIIFGFICEWIDSSIGMGYGTILSPLLILLGFSVSLVVPSILITQAFGGISAAIFHHKHGNGNFKVKSKSTYHFFSKLRKQGIVSTIRDDFSDDLKTVIIITSLGIIATIISTFVAVNLNKTILTTYISILVIIMGALIMFNFKFQYSLNKILLVGIISSFNKGLSGGGFGPIVTGGQMVFGKENKKAIACTTASEPLICITAFISYFILKGITDWNLIYALGIGAIIAGILGPLTTKKLNKQSLRYVVGVTMLFLGTVSLFMILKLINLQISI